MFVLGAGASLGEAQDRRPVQTREHPPLDANFFQRVAKYHNDALFSRVQSQAERLGIDDLARTDAPVGLEDYLGRLYFNVQHNPLRASVQAYFQLIDLYAWEVLRTTNWMIGKAGLIKRVLQKEIAADRSVSVITFNIDLLIENALERLSHSRPSASWGLEDAYGFAPPANLSLASALAPSRSEHRARPRDCSRRLGVTDSLLVTPSRRERCGRCTRRGDRFHANASGGELPVCCSPPRPPRGGNALT